MLTAEQYARVKELMCGEYGLIFECNECPLYVNPLSGDNGDPEKAMLCGEFAIKYPAEAVKRVHLWLKENKHRFPEYCGGEGE